MAPKIELTLAELARASLCSPNIDNNNIAGLLNLVNTLLKKLGCENEKVILTGHEADCVRRIFEKSKPSPLQYNDDNIKSITSQLSEIDKVEKRINEVDKKLDHHIAEIRYCVEFNDANFNWDAWLFSEETISGNSFVGACNLESELACFLMQYTDFHKKLLRRLTQPVIHRFFLLEDKVEHLHDLITGYLAKLEEHQQKLILIDGIYIRMEKLEHVVEENYLIFLGTMQEVQDLLDTKLDKLHLPALKQFIKRSFEKFGKLFSEISAEKVCPKVPGLITDCIKCMCCGAKVCAEKGVYPTGMLHDLRQPKNLLIQTNPCYHATNDTNDNNKDNLNNDNKIKCPCLLSGSPSEEFQGPTCSELVLDYEEPPKVRHIKMCNVTFEFLRGTNDTFYRKAKK